MPDSDLILNVRQLSQYPNLGVEATDNLLMQRGGLGGSYLSAMAEQIVSTALADGSAPLQVGVSAPGGAVGAQIFTVGLSTTIDGWWMWNGYVAGDLDLRAATGAAGLMRFDGTDGWQWFAAEPLGANSPIVWNNVFTVDPTGQGSLVGSLYLGRDPIAPNEAATAQWVGDQINAYYALSVHSVNGRRGDITLTVQDVRGAAPFFSPRFEGQPRAPTPSPNSCSNRLATTAFVHGTVAQYICALQASNVTSFNGRTGAVVLTDADIAAALEGATLPFAPIDSPNFTGLPTAPTPPPGSADGQLATTAFVMNAVTESTTGVASFNGRTGAVTLAAADVTGVGGALLVSPVFSGTPQAPTAAPGTSSQQIASTAFVGAAIAASGFAPTNSPTFTGIPGAPTAPVNSNTTQLATCAFVMNQLNAIDAGVTTFNGRSGAVSLIGNDVSAAGGALLVSPVFTGTPSAPTASPGTSTGQLATTAFVMAALASVGGVSSFNGRAGAVTLSSADIAAVGVSSFNTRIGAVTLTLADVTGAGGASQASLAAYAPLASPAFTGTVTIPAGASIAGFAPLASPAFTGAPTAPTAALSISSTQLATTAFVRTGVSDGSNAAAGQVGEYVASAAGGGSMTSAVLANVAAQSLTPGDWDVYARCVFTPTGPPSAVGALQLLVSNQSGAVGTLTNNGQLVIGATFNVGTTQSVFSGMARVSIAATTTIYAVAQVNFTGGAMTAAGYLYARRAR